MSVTDPVHAADELAALRARFDRLPAPRVLAVAAGKGGVGKSSVAVNVATVLAAACWQVTLVDLDPQASCSTLLGLAEGDTDSGKGMLAAVAAGIPDLAVPVMGVRPGLDLVASGVETRKLSDWLTIQPADQRAGAVRAVLDHVGAGRDLVVVDARPAGEVLGEVAVGAADWLVVPARTDSMSSERSLDVLGRLTGCSGSGRLLGVVLFAVNRSATRVLAETRGQLAGKLAGAAPVFSAAVRGSERAAKGMAEHGLTAAEYANAASALRKPIWEDRDRTAPQFAHDPTGLASDYEQLTLEVVRQILEVSR